MSALRWGILSTAGIGRVVVNATRSCDTARFVAVASRDGARAAAFAGDLGLAVSCGSYEELLAREDIDAVYVPLPIAMHTEWTVKALQAGKHVLCEKPFAMTAGDAALSFDAAETADRLVSEALMWRHHPQTTLARRLLAEGRIGRLALIRATLTVRVEPGDIRRTAATGGGAVLDLGCYCVSAVRLFGGSPRQVQAVQVADPAPGAEGCDLRLAAIVTLPDDVLGQFDVGLDLTRRDELELVGTDGTLVIRDPWLCRAGAVEVRVNGRTEHIAADPDGRFGLTGGDADAYRIVFEAASAAIAGRTAPAFGRADAVEQATVLETLRHAARTGNRRPVAP